jgi:imidazole glycerol-phosphate synthase subunit HisH
MGIENKKVCILDYGSGNVKSVFNMFATFECDVNISNADKDMAEATHLVLPGVGSFGASMKKIKNKISLEALTKEVFENKKPFLGICVGMQVLADKGTEFGEFDGLGWIKGSVNRMKPGLLKLPHVGWNNVTNLNGSKLLKDLENNQDFYFVHSYAFEALDESSAIAKSDYGQEFCAIVEKDNIFGVQFHPEKSQGAGKILINNFLEQT